MEVANYEMESVIEEALIRSGHLELQAEHTLHAHDQIVPANNYIATGRGKSSDLKLNAAYSSSCRHSAPRWRGWRPAPYGRHVTWLLVTRDTCWKCAATCANPSRGGASSGYLLEGEDPLQAQQRGLCTAAPASAKGVMVSLRFKHLHVLWRWINLKAPCSGTRSTGH